MQRWYVVAARKLEMVSPPATLAIVDEVSICSATFVCSSVYAATYTKVDVWAFSSSSDTSPTLTFPTRLVMKSFLSLVLFNRLAKFSIRYIKRWVSSHLLTSSRVYAAFFAWIPDTNGAINRPMAMTSGNRRRLSTSVTKNRYFVSISNQKCGASVCTASEILIASECRYPELTIFDAVECLAECHLTEDVKCDHLIPMPHV